MDEILRIIDALQTAERHNVLATANWKPGDDVLFLPLYVRGYYRKK
ncbi:MAG: hypothetical protein J7L07_01110 [Candidatus Odinarchaeota archaeon]|nr:hypothetical protein [Candidatus Odinarchaeota archaeon]